MTFTIFWVGFGQRAAGSKAATTVTALKAMDRGLKLLAR